jgi:WD40 repeat protein
MGLETVCLAYVRCCRSGLLATLLVIAPNFAGSESKPAVAYSRGSTVTLATASGRATRTFPTNRAGSDFAISPDLKLLVTVAATTTYGGALDLEDIGSGARSRLVSGPVYFKQLPRGEKEVYADPRFSPDGKQVVFAVHVNSPGDGNDAMGAAGPIAIVDIASRQVRILKSTTNIDGEAEGLCFANTPMWSANGKWIFFSCEDGAFITDAGGKTLRPLKIGSDEKPWTTGIGWVGENCVLYVQAVDGGRDDTYEVRLLNLRTSQTQDATSVLPGLHGAVSGLIEASELAKVRRTPSGLQIESETKAWTLPVGSHAHLLGGWTTAHLPAMCK